MGKPVVPLILRDLEKSPDHWFWALRAITGEDPVKPEQRGRMQQMAQAWIQWGKEYGYDQLVLLPRLGQWDDRPSRYFRGGPDRENQSGGLFWW